MIQAERQMAAVLTAPIEMPTCNTVLLRIRNVSMALTRSG